MRALAVIVVGLASACGTQTAPGAGTDCRGVVDDACDGTEDGCRAALERACACGVAPSVRVVDVSTDARAVNLALPVWDGTRVVLLERSEVRSIVALDAALRPVARRLDPPGLDGMLVATDRVLAYVTEWGMWGPDATIGAHIDFLDADLSTRTTVALDAIPPSWEAIAHDGRIAIVGWPRVDPASTEARLAVVVADERGVVAPYRVVANDVLGSYAAPHEAIGTWANGAFAVLAPSFADPGSAVIATIGDDGALRGTVRFLPDHPSFWEPASFVPTPDGYAFSWGAGVQLVSADAMSTHTAPLPRGDLPIDRARLASHGDRIAAAYFALAEMGRYDLLLTELDAAGHVHGSANVDHVTSPNGARVVWAGFSWAVFYVDGLSRELRAARVCPAD